MAIEAGMAAKAVAGLCLVGGGGVGAYYSYKYSTSSKTDTPVLETKYDKALLTFLDDTNQDIIFEVMKTNDASETALTEDDVKLQAATTKVNVKVKVSTSAKEKFKAAADALDNKITELKAKNKDNKDWTWTCSFEFKKDAAQTSAELEEATRRRILGASDVGLFGILRKDLSTYTNTTGTSHWTLQELKNVKTKFIKDCAKARTNNKDIEGSSDEVGTKLTSAIEAFQFEAKADAATKLVAKSGGKFDEWFPANYGTKTYHTG